MKIKTKEDYIKLLSCIEFEDKWKWVAVDENGFVHVHTDVPERHEGFWLSETGEYGDTAIFVFGSSHIYFEFDWQDSLVEINK